MKEMEPKDQQLMVALRIRPLSGAELEEGATVIAHKVGDQMVVLMDPGEDPEDTLRTHRSREKTFIFDTVFDQHASQEDVYRATTQHLVEGVVSGYNATVFAYGPSGAGKTYTMLGMDAEPGIYLQTLSDLFRAIEETRGNVDYSVSMSYLEIYNEMIRDLLNPSSGLLDLREDARGSIQIAGITEVSTSNAQEIMQLLTKGNRQRTQEPTAANGTSSRSHALLQVTVRQQSRGAPPRQGLRLGRLFLVDLAGSERASQTQNRGKRMQEGAHINRSLLALGNCINALSEKGGGRTQYVNFRDSKLTRLLKDALGGNSRTVMIAHISPASTSFEESRTTLLYAYRAKNIKTRVKRNLLTVSYHLDQYTDVISDLRRQIVRLKSKIERQEQKQSEQGARDTQVAMPAQDSEDSRLQMQEIRAQLLGAFKEQLEMRRSLVELEDASIELHAHVSRHLLAIADWEREKTHHRGQARTPEGAQQQVAADTDQDGDQAEPAEPHEVALAREEVNVLLAEQRKTVALKAGLERRLASAKRKASRLERTLPRQAVSEGQREALRLLCGAHEREAESAALQAGRLRTQHLLGQKDLLIRHLQRHRLLSERLIRGQRQLIQGEARAPRLPRLCPRSHRCGERGDAAEIWEREKTHHRGQARTPEGAQQQVAADTDQDGDQAEPAEPHEVALAREEVNVLLAEQRKTVALKAGLERRLASAKRKASRLERTLPRQAVSEGQREALRLLCGAHEREAESAALQAGRLRTQHLLGQKDLLIRHLQRHRLLSERLIRGQRQLIQDSGLRVPTALDEQYGLYARELGEGSLDRLLLLHSAVAGSLQGGSVVNASPSPEESSRDQPDDRKDLPWGARFELETDSDGYRSSKSTPSKKLGRQDALLPPLPLRVLLTPPAQEQSSSLSTKNLVSKLSSPAHPELGPPRVAAVDLKEVAQSTKSIALIAASRRSKAQDHECGSGRSSLHLPEEVAPDSRDLSPADRRWPCASPGRDSSSESKARRKRSPGLPCGAQPATETPQLPSQEPLAESQTPPVPHQLSTSSGRGLFPAVPAASKVQPSLRGHAGYGGVSS
ncbi:PREDICTED: kinesin-like protein KIF19 [Miniopterus natalensis]|uniref:kinesin-like protein KIF19 n=1 Tax=Miniopterus natalensis TaxID=291302 RepID=UPI0007A6BA52|nr:PREDICTED: kinesin-like protein KIF19 [Miniopterus natalensis]